MRGVEVEVGEFGYHCWFLVVEECLVTVLGGRIGIGIDSLMGRGWARLCGPGDGSGIGRQKLRTCTKAAKCLRQGLLPKFLSHNTVNFLKRKEKDFNLGAIYINIPTSMLLNARS